MVVLILAVMWIAVLAPPLLRSRADGRPSSSVSSFRRQLSTLQRMPSAPVRMPSARSAAPGTYRISSGYAATATAVRARPSFDRRALQRAAQRRRRQHVLVALGGAVLVTALLGWGMGARTMMYANVVADIVFGGYVYLLVQIRRAEEERLMRRMWADAA
jgi:hypothetical protein